MQPQGALSITELVLNASFLVQCVMLFLLALSILSWTIIILRNNQYRIGRIKADAFEDRFWSGIDLNNLYQDCMKRPDELVGLEVIYSAGFKEFVRLVNSGPADQDVVMDGTYRQMKVACSREVELLEAHLPTLATIGSISPYIGLFGTVWGIMHAFVALAEVKNATLAMVAPPIAEALIATAMGLFAAIPAVMFYNRFVTKVEALENRYYNFMDEFSTILNRRLVTIRSQLNRQNQSMANSNSSYGQNEMPPAPMVNNVQSNMGSSPNGNDLSAMNNINALNSGAAPNIQEQAQAQEHNVYDSYEQNDDLNNQATISSNEALMSSNMAPRSNTYSSASQTQDFAKAMHQPNKRSSASLANAQAANAAPVVNQGSMAAISSANSQASRGGREFVNNPKGQTRPNNQALNGVNAVSGQNINASAFNDPNMAANYRGIVPPRSGNTNMANAQLPGGPAVIAKGAPSAAMMNQARPNGPVYRTGHDFESKKEQKAPLSEPQYISPGGQSKRRANQVNSEN